MVITKAAYDDLAEILQLQYLAYLSEAVLHNNFSIPPLRQNLTEIQDEYRKGIFLKACDANGTIVGSVRGHSRDGTLFIGKLMVHPEHQGAGLGSSLLLAMENTQPKLRYELFTSKASVRNLRLYQRQGYREFMEKEIAPGLTFIYLYKTPIRM